MATPPRHREMEVYGNDILIALGVVSLRAGHLEDYLAHFMSAISGISIHRAMAILYSTQNAKARLDMIRSLLQYSGFSEERTRFATALLNRAQKLANRRNDFIHGQFMISRTGGDPPPPPKAVLIHRKTATTTPFKSRPIKAHEIDKLADDYETLRQELWNFYVDVTGPSVPDAPSRGTPD
jgi:hypothetical protein